MSKYSANHVWNICLDKRPWSSLYSVLSQGHLLIIQDFQMVHAKAVAQIEAEEKTREDLSPLPVSKDLHASDMHVLSSEGSLSGFSSGNSEFESLGDKRASDSMQGVEHTPAINVASDNPMKMEEMVDPDSPETVSALQELCQEGSLEGRFVGQDPQEAGKVIFKVGIGVRITVVVVTGV